MRRSRGFTLLEVLLAMAIAGTAIVALQRTQAGQVNILHHVRYSIVATWVAENRLTEMEALVYWPKEEVEVSEVTMGGRDWIVTSTFSDTLQKEIKRVNIEVALADSPNRSEAALEGYIKLPRI